MPKSSPTPTPTPTPTPPDAIASELDALRALYGDHAVDASSSATSTAVAVALPCAPPLTLSTRLDHARYPASARPRRPTLRGAGLCAAACARLADAALPPDAPVGLDGEVCLFDYCEAVQTALPGFLSANATADADADAGADADSADAGDADSDADGDAQPDIVHGPPVEDRRSVFQGHVAALPRGRASLAGVLRALRGSRKGASATHHTWALRAGGADECDDDGERGGGRVVLDVARHAGLSDCVVVVSRWFGGVKLGPARFRHIGSAARQAVDAWRARGERA